MTKRMRITEQIRLAWYTMGWSVRWLPLVVAVVGTVCLFLGGSIHREIILEKAAPCELIVTVQNGGFSTAINSESFGQIQQLEEVLAISFAWTFPAKLGFDEYEAEMTLCGLDASYLSGVWLQGTSYPENSAMPYLVLNEAAVKAFRNEKNIPVEGAEKLDWSAEQVTLRGETERDVRICGILADGKSEPTAYLSQEQVKALRLEAGMESPADTLWLRLKNSGVRGKVVAALSGLGLQADAGDEREASWELRAERRNLYWGSGGIMLFCSVLLMLFLDKLWKKDEAQAYAVLAQMGIPFGRMRAVIFWRWIYVYAIGGIISAGIIGFI